MQKQTHHLKYLVFGIVSMALALICLSSFVVSAAISGYANNTVISEERIWNRGVIVMNFETHLNGQWRLNFQSASDGFIKETSMTVHDAQQESLFADIECGTVPQGASLTLWLVQGDVAKAIDVTQLESPLTYPLTEFENGKIHIRLQINGVKDVSSHIFLQ